MILPTSQIFYAENAKKAPFFDVNQLCVCVHKCYEADIWLISSIIVPILNFIIKEGIFTHVDGYGL